MYATNSKVTASLFFPQENSGGYGEKNVAVEMRQKAISMVRRTNLIPKFNIPSN